MRKMIDVMMKIFNYSSPAKITRQEACVGYEIVVRQWVKSTFSCAFNPN
jgi:hypothetical protein